MDESPPLANALAARHVAMIAVGGVIGAGLFIGSSAAILTAGPAVVISYALAGALTFLVMRMLGEMAVARPRLGSFVSYIRAALGPRAAFVAGWLYWYFWIIAVGAETIAGATLLHEWVVLPVWAIGLGLVALLTASNLLSVRTYGEVEYWFSLTKVVAILAFIVLAIGGLGRAAARGATPAAMLAAHGGWFPHGAGAVLGAIPIVIFSLCGAEIASIAAAESDDPAANVAAAARSVALRIAVFYVAAIVLIVCLVPWSSLEIGHSPFAAAMATIGVPGATTLMSAVILVAVLSCLNSGLYVSSRAVFELAAAGDAPHWLAATGDGHVPTRATLLAAAAGLVAALASIISPGLVFAFLLNTSGSVILVVYGLIAMAQISSRRAVGCRTPTFAMWLFPWLSYAVIAGIALILIAMATRADQRSQVLAGTFSVGVAVVCSRTRALRRTTKPGYGHRLERDPSPRNSNYDGVG